MLLKLVQYRKTKLMECFTYIYEHKCRLCDNSKILELSYNNCDERSLEALKFPNCFKTLTYRTIIYLRYPILTLILQILADLRILNFSNNNLIKIFRLVYLVHKSWRHNSAYVITQNYQTFKFSEIRNYVDLCLCEKLQ